jgi:hypothetical protein
MAEKKGIPFKTKATVLAANIVLDKRKQEDFNTSQAPVIMGLADAHKTIGPGYTARSEATVRSVDNIEKQERKAQIAAKNGDGDIYHNTQNNIFLDTKYGYARRTMSSENDCLIEFNGKSDHTILSIHYFICPGGGKELLRDTIKSLQDLKWKFSSITLTPADGLDPEKTKNGADISDLINFYTSIGFEFHEANTLIGDVSYILSRLEELITTPKKKTRLGGSRRSKKTKRRRNKKTTKKRKTKRRRQTKKRGKR